MKWNTNDVCIYFWLICIKKSDSLTFLSIVIWFHSVSFVKWIHSMMDWSIIFVQIHMKHYYFFFNLSTFSLFRSFWVPDPALENKFNFLTHRFEWMRAKELFVTWCLGLNVSFEHSLSWNCYNYSSTIWMWSGMESNGMRKKKR